MTGEYTQRPKRDALCITNLGAKYSLKIRFTTTISYLIARISFSQAYRSSEAMLSNVLSGAAVA
jgi:hypothetical protein